MNISIVPASLDDAEALLRVQIAAFHHDGKVYPGGQLGGPPDYDSIGALHQMIQDEACYKITDGEACIGGIALRDLGRGHFHLGRIFLDPAYHNQGIGTQAMRFIEEAYPAATRWTLNTPAWAVRNRHFYEKLGYVQVGEYYLAGVPLVDYEKRMPRQANFKLWKILRAGR